MPPKDERGYTQSERQAASQSKAEEYDSWYRTPRGRWIGELEYGLVRRLLRPRPQESVLDIGCGTGYFTRRFARDQDGAVIGVDPDGDAVEYARQHTAARETYVVGRGEALPFPSRSFDLCVSITAMCFLQDQVTFLREMARVAKRCVAVGLLNRHSLLWRREGRSGGQGGYRGAHWHSKREVSSLFAQAGLPGVRVRTGLHVPSGSRAARVAETILPGWWPWGGFLVVIGDDT